MNLQVSALVNDYRLRALVFPISVFIFNFTELIHIQIFDIRFSFFEAREVFLSRNNFDLAFRARLLLNQAQICIYFQDPSEFSFSRYLNQLATAFFNL